jgi:hypothetical protein
VVDAFRGGSGAEAHIGGHREVREQKPVLRDPADATVVGGDMAGVGGIVDDEAVEQQSAIVEALQAGHEAKQGGLAGSVRTHHRHDLTGLD